MKLSPRDKNALLLFACIILIAITTITMLYPSFIKYPYSYSEIEDRQSEIRELNVTIEKNNENIENLNTRVDSLKIESQRYSIDANNLRSGLSARDLELHIPSILISLEDNARNNDIDIIIHYDQLKSHSSDIYEKIIDDEGLMDRPGGLNGAPLDVDEDEDIVDVDEDEDIVDIDDLGRTKIKNSRMGYAMDELLGEPEGDERDNRDNRNDRNNRERNPFEIPSDGTVSQKEGIEGVNIATIPISINGDFTKLRKFTRLIDEVDFVEPNYIEFESDGNNINGYILLHIYYGEV